MPEALKLDHVADAMKGIDIAIMSTHGENKTIASRPMSKNGDVRYDGTSYFFLTKARPALPISGAIPTSRLATLPAVAFLERRVSRR
jgi:hypothetical protein